MKAAIPQLQEIYNDMVQMFAQKEYDERHADSLFKGPWGALLFMFYYEKYIDDTVDHAADCLEAVYENFSPDKGIDYAFCNGYSGPFWLLHHLNHHDFVELDIDYLLADFIGNAIVQSEFFVEQEDFDFLHGSAGICNFLVSFAHLPEVRAHLSAFVAGLLQLSEMTPLGRSLPVFTLHDLSIEKGVDAFSLAHGNCSLHILLAKIYQAGIAQDTCRQLIYENIAFMLQHKNPDVAPDSQVALYPGILDGSGIHSRLSWCYGDLNVAHALWYCGKVFGEAAWKQEALDIMHHSARRDTEEAAGIVDNCLCHGSGGIAAFFRKFWHETGDRTFYESATLWHNKALEKVAFSPDKQVHGIRVWQGKDKQWDYAWDLLDGSTGVGLSLLSHTQDQALAWDEFLLLS
ncbi:lanthionine synthetase LanC family protein [Chitinophaga nivalis]|uniref:Lanthionine synthetase n=1 Tax=Chitinophaga nivalis TaxID=2991709 RepID=A0ABT3IJG4_9BACT|nr:lanthionine synthetase LanC family protein [Chitinophaga nivalis]MCW3466207.1 hypothetical protein [Chitinophaga nivalis]MCW3484102.1 hypothetical protein [Chitinophaga nivalis]